VPDYWTNLVQKHYGAVKGDANYSYLADLNHDGVIDVKDLAIASKWDQNLENFGTMGFDKYVTLGVMVALLAGFAVAVSVEAQK
jgi:hypothetical protein